jgi:ribosomal protein S18 acetylase RimI-like enzyme
VAFRIRPYRASDRDLVQECLTELWHHHVEIDATRLGVRAPELERRYASGMLRRYWRQGGFVLIGELDGVAAGYVAGWVSQFSRLERMIQRPNRRGHVSELAVLTRFRRRGVGSRLLRAAEARLKRKGCDLVGLDVSVDNPGARALYEGLGYRPRNLYLLKRIGKPPLDWAAAGGVKKT